MTSEQPDGQLQKQHNIGAQITNDIRQDAYETNKTNNRILKELIKQYNNWT